MTSAVFESLYGRFVTLTGTVSGIHVCPTYTGTTSTIPEALSTRITKGSTFLSGIRITSTATKASDAIQPAPATHQAMRALRACIATRSRSHEAASAKYAWASNLLVTAAEILGGFGLGALVGVVLAMLFCWSPLLSLVLLPLFVTLNMIPKVALTNDYQNRARNF